MLIGVNSTLISPHVGRPAGQWQGIGASPPFVPQERSPFFGDVTLGAQQYVPMNCLDAKTIIL